MGKCQVQFTTV